MVTIVNDADVSRDLIEERRAQGLDRWDEVWEGTYCIMTQPSDDHQDLVAGLTAMLYEVVQRSEQGKVRPGVNVSDRVDDWRENYRCPDVVVYLAENPAEDHGAFWYGGPDLAVEILRPGDQAREKRGFYARIGTRELLIVDRDPWSLELYRPTGGQLLLQGRSTLDTSDPLTSETVPLSFQLAAGGDRPHIRVHHMHDSREWTI